MNSDLLDITATFFDPNDDDCHNEKPIQPVILLASPLKFNKPIKRQKNIAIQTSQSSNNSSPQVTPRRFGISYVSAEKPQGTTNPFQKYILPNQHALYASYNHKKQNLTQKILITENSKKMFLQLYKSPQSIMQESIIQPKDNLSPNPSMDLLKSLQSIVKEPDQPNSINDVKSQLTRDNERLRNLVMNQQKQQNFLQKEKLVYNEAKLNLQQRSINKPKQRESLKNQIHGGSLINDIFQNTNAVKVIPLKCQDTSQQSLKTSKLFQSTNGTFRMIRVKNNNQKSLNYPKILIPNYQSLHDEPSDCKLHISQDVFLPRIDTSRDLLRDTSRDVLHKEMSRDAQQLLRDMSKDSLKLMVPRVDTSRDTLDKQSDSKVKKSTTVHEYEDSLWKHSSKPQLSYIQTESSPVSPSPPLLTLQTVKTTLGFKPNQKQGGQSFLTRRPQAKIVSRIFSSRSDKN